VSDVVWCPVSKDRLVVDTIFIDRLSAFADFGAKSGRKPTKSTLV
jgi:hypothetical protein